MTEKGLIFICVGMFLMEINGYELPTVTLTSCMHETATVTIENAEEGGIIYFRTDTAYNMIPSTNGTIEHQCQFDECNIEWDERFYVIVQRRMLIQTRYDVIIWFVCSTDFDAIQPVVINFDEMTDSNLTTSVYKPEASISIYSGSEKLENQAEVKLGSDVTMHVEITNDPDRYFDVSPRSCFASGITIYEEHCPVSEDLLGAFNTSGVGFASVTFGVFRPTSINGGPVSVVFTCILEVCNTNCEEVDCTNSTSSKRKRREVRQEDNPFIIRGFTLMVVTEEGREINEKPHEETFCLALYAVVALLGSFILITAVTIAITGYNYQRSSVMKEEINMLKMLKDGKKEVDKVSTELTVHAGSDKKIQQSLHAVSGIDGNSEKFTAETKACKPDMTYTTTAVGNRLSHNGKNLREETVARSEVVGDVKNTISLYIPADFKTYRRKSLTKTSMKH